MDIFKIYSPSGELAKAVSSIVYYEGYNPSHSVERLLPDGTLNLLIELGDYPQYTYDNNDLSKKREYKKAWISGMQAGYISISSAALNAMMVIQFKPNGAHPILKLPINELNNLIIEADLVFGNEVNLLREHLMEAALPNQKILIAEHWLEKSYKSSESVPEAVVQYAVEETLLNPTANTIKAIAEQTGYSQQHFINLFKKYVGFTPKQYQKIVRFNQILNEIELRNNIDWAKLSLDLGYFDQAHFIRDFKKFSGFSPEKYLGERGEHLNYIPVK